MRRSRYINFPIVIVIPMKKYSFAALGAEERQWSFVPDHPWRRGAHRLAVATTVEDLADNNIGKPFDVDVFTGVQRRMSTESVSRGFEVR